MFKIENQWKTTQVFDATDGRRHTENTRTEDAGENPMIQDTKEDLITEDPEEDPIKHWYHYVGYSRSDRGSSRD